MNLQLPTKLSVNSFKHSEMKEIIFEKQGAQPKLSTTERPRPGDDQILVKSLWAAMNPV